jgi:hypothetical protein
MVKGRETEENSVTLKTDIFIREELGLNLGLDTGYPD